MGLIRPDDSRPFAALAERGYTVIPSFFSPTDLELVQQDFESIREKGRRRRGELPSHLRFDDARVQPLHARITALIQAVSAHTPFKGDLLPVTIGNYICSGRVQYGLHRDHGSFCDSLSTHGYKVWIPIIKPDPSRDGMTFVRMDKFAEREPEVAKRIAGRIIRTNGERELSIVLHSSVETVQLRYPLSEISETPDVRVGDVVLFRGQHTLHGSQVEQPPLEEPVGRKKSERVALAFPVRWPHDVISRAVFLRDTQRRAYLGKIATAAVLASLWHHKKDKITFAEFTDFESALRLKRIRPLAIFCAALVAYSAYDTFRRAPSSPSETT